MEALTRSPNRYFMIRFDWDAGRTCSLGEYVGIIAAISALRHHAVLLEIRGEEHWRRIRVFEHFEDGLDYEWPGCDDVFPDRHYLTDFVRRAFDAGGIRLGVCGGLDLVLHPVSQANDEGGTIHFIVPPITKPMAAQVENFWQVIDREKHEDHRPGLTFSDWIVILCGITLWGLMVCTTGQLLWALFTGSPPGFGLGRLIAMVALKIIQYSDRIFRILNLGWNAPDDRVIGRGR
jgi:hypothetical protein